MRRIAEQFDEMADALDRQREQQLTFLAAVAHDLKNPLTALKAAAQMAEREAEQPERLQRRLQVVRRQIDKLRRLVDDLLDVSRLEVGKLALDLQVADLRESIEEACELFDGDPAHPIALQLPAEPVELAFDPVRMAQVFGNLLSNAIKYSPEGGPVQVRLHRSEREAIVEVEDRGLGIPAAELPRIFQPFRRGRSVAGEIPGVGLGLSASKKLVEAHGGSIEVESQPGVGSTFRVRLPLN